MKRESGHMKVKVLSIAGKDEEDAEEELNAALKELEDYYIVDIKPLPKNLVAIMYLSKKKSSFEKHRYEEDDEED